MEDVKFKAIITEGKKVTRKIIVGKHYTDEEWDQKEKEAWEKVEHG